MSTDLNQESSAGGTVGKKASLDKERSPEGLGSNSFPPGRRQNCHAGSENCPTGSNTLAPGKELIDDCRLSEQRRDRCLEIQTGQVKLLDDERKKLEQLFPECPAGEFQVAVWMAICEILHLRAKVARDTNLMADATATLRGQTEALDYAMDKLREIGLGLNKRESGELFWTVYAGSLAEHLGLSSSEAWNPVPEDHEPSIRAMYRHAGFARQDADVEEMVCQLKDWIRAAQEGWGLEIRYKLGGGSTPPIGTSAATPDRADPPEWGLHWLASLTMAAVDQGVAMPDAEAIARRFMSWVGVPAIDDQAVAEAAMQMIKQAPQTGADPGDEQPEPDFIGDAIATLQERSRRVGLKWQGFALAELVSVLQSWNMRVPAAARLIDDIVSRGYTKKRTVAGIVLTPAIPEDEPAAVEAPVAENDMVPTLGVLLTRWALEANRQDGTDVVIIPIGEIQRFYRMLNVDWGLEALKDELRGLGYSVKPGPNGPEVVWDLNEGDLTEDPPTRTSAATLAEIEVAGAEDLAPEPPMGTSAATLGAADQVAERDL